MDGHGHERGGHGLVVGKHGVGLVVGWCTHCRLSLLSL